jgi:hypothetical protein
MSVGSVLNLLNELEDKYYAKISMNLVKKKFSVNVTGG